MTVIGTPEEINKVLQGINPDFPRQNLESLPSCRCCYVLGGVPVEICLISRPPEDPPA